jgi:hypothetical protein
MARKASRWYLYIDESGSFAHDQEVVVAGMLSHEEHTGASAGDLRIALRSIASELPWPLHNALLNKPVLTAIGSSLRHDGADDEVAEKVVSLLEQQDETRLERVLQAVSADRNPEYEDVAILDRIVRERDPHLYRDLRTRRREIRAAIRDVIASIGAQHRLQAAGSIPAVLLVACGETEEFFGDGFGSDSERSQESDAGTEQEDFGKIATERYLALLHVLLERVVALLEGDTGTHEVRVLLLSRPLRDPTIGKKVPAFIRHLGTAINRIDVSDRVRLVPWGVPSYNGAVDPALVIADFIASNSRMLLGRFRTPLIQIEAELSRHIGIASRQGQAPALAAAGSAAAYISSVRLNELPDDWTPEGKRRWAYEQALEWGALLRGRR